MPERRVLSPEPECPLWVISGHTDKSAPCPLYRDAGQARAAPVNGGWRDLRGTLETWSSSKSLKNKGDFQNIGGEGGIRTHGKVTRTTVFESANYGLSQIFHQQNKKIQVYGKRTTPPVQAKKPHRFNPPLPPAIIWEKQVGLLCNGSHTFSFSKATPRGLRWDPLCRLVQCSIDACLAESCPLDDGRHGLSRVPEAILLISPGVSQRLRDRPGLMEWGDI